jgi:hypothetical protein
LPAQQIMHPSIAIGRQVDDERAEHKDANAPAKRLPARHATAWRAAPRAPTIALASSLALIPAAIAENACQRSQIPVVIARTCPSDANSMKRRTLPNRTLQHNQNIKSP